MARAFVAVGSNIEPATNVRNAMRALANHTRIIAISTVYLTEPESRPEQPPYYNCVAEIETDMAPRPLKFEVLRRIESGLGRERVSDKHAPRTIDLDLILYDDLTMNTGDLLIPDPDVATRPFVALPLKELVPDMILPGTSSTISKLAAALPAGGMLPLNAYTADLRMDILGQ